MRELMALTVNEIQFEDVVAFCSHQTREHARLEYKREFSGKDAGKQIGKSVAALANTQGGILLIGVREESDGKPMKSPEGEHLGNNPKAAVQSVCVHNVFPPIVPEVSEYLRNPSDHSRGFLVVRVAASEDIHTVDGGKGVYIRANDQSEPVRATLDRIAWMMQRRGKAVALQESRRERALTQLRRALHADEGPGIVDVAIGPRLTVEPLLTPQELRKRAREWSVESQCFNWYRTPIGSNERIAAVANGIYALDGASWQNSECAGFMDVFGNVALVTKLRRQLSLNPSVIGYERLKEDLPQEDGQIDGIYAGYAVERIICVVRTTLNMYLATGFVGVVDLFFRAPNTRGLPLACPTNYGAVVLGTCPVDDEVIVQRDFVAPSELSKDPRELLDGFVREMIWAWGCSRDDVPSTVLEAAMGYHLGDGWRAVASKLWGLTK